MDSHEQLIHDAKMALKKDMVNYMHLNDYKYMSPETYHGFLQDIKVHLKYNLKSSQELLHQKADYKSKVTKVELKLLIKYINQHK